MHIAYVCCILSALIASQWVWPINLPLRMHSKLTTSFSSNATYGINRFKSSALNSIHIYKTFKSKIKKKRN